MIKDGEVVCSSTVDLVTKLAIALAISDTEQTQVNYTIILGKGSKTRVTEFVR